MNSFLYISKNEFLQKYSKKSFKYTNLYSLNLLPDNFYHKELNNEIIVIFEENIKEVYRLYFMSNELTPKNYGFLLNNNNKIIVDIIEQKNSNHINNYIQSLGFIKYKELKRMSLVGTKAFSEKGFECIRFGSLNDLYFINEIFIKYFDKFSEQIPNLKKITNFISLNQIIIYENKNKKLGFLIYEIFGKTQVLRYWFVLNEYRGLKIGIKLYNKFLSLGPNCTRRLHWVLSENIDAIAIYQKLNYEFDGLINTVLIKE